MHRSVRRRRLRARRETGAPARARGYSLARALPGDGEARAALEPHAQEIEPRDGRGRIRTREECDLGEDARVRGGHAQERDRGGGHGDRDAECTHARELVLPEAGARPHPEREPAVRGGVRDRGRDEREHVSDRRRNEDAKKRVDDRVRDRARDADAPEREYLPRERQGDAAQAHPKDSADIVYRGLRDIDTRIRIVRPIDRDLADPHPRTLREDEELRVEEPCLVLHGWNEPARRDGGDGLESALRVAELCAEAEMEEEVVGTRDQLALCAPAYARASREPASDRGLTVAGRELRQEQYDR